VKNTKQLLFQKLIELLNQKIEVLGQEIASTKASKETDTKSSAGDKFETGRAMMQMELDKNEAQLNKTQKLKKELTSINSEQKKLSVEFGSLVRTSQGNYLISVALGKIELNSETFYTISLASPIGMVLQHKKQGEFIEFQGKKIEIISVE